jgi:hypothetical protein
MYLTAAATLSTGLRMFVCPGTAYWRNVAPIVCSRPMDGSPRLALMSQLFWAFGSPPDSCMTRPATVDTFPGVAGMPASRSPAATHARTCAVEPLPATP